MKRGLMDDPVKGKELSLDFVAEPSTLLKTSDGWTKEQPQTDTGQSRRGGEYCGWELKHVGWCGMIYYIVVQYVGLLRLLWSLLNGLLFHFNNNRADGCLAGSDGQERSLFNCDKWDSQSTYQETRHFHHFGTRFWWTLKMHRLLWCVLRKKLFFWLTDSSRFLAEKGRRSFRYSTGWLCRKSCFFFLQENVNFVLIFIPREGKLVQQLPVLPRAEEQYSLWPSAGS